AQKRQTAVASSPMARIGVRIERSKRPLSEARQRLPHVHSSANRVCLPCQSSLLPSLSILLRLCKSVQFGVVYILDSLGYVEIYLGPCYRGWSLFGCVSTRTCYF